MGQAPLTATPASPIATIRWHIVKILLAQLPTSRTAKPNILSTSRGSLRMISGADNGRGMRQNPEVGLPRYISLAVLLLFLFYFNHVSGPHDIVGFSFIYFFPTRSCLLFPFGVEVFCLLLPLRLSFLCLLFLSRVGCMQLA